eukprot:TRINITY_DN3908_c0_g4_i1.p1 TRINITY_DN3908_c0_g4~~TRINITY_DN3908_c0_g4_i1.p1  ORF type:complete len:474 (-),score=22.05 TRINITY_DN3908_c0_g4_i1:58-1479(-)
MSRKQVTQTQTQTQTQARTQTQITTATAQDSPLTESFLHPHAWLNDRDHSYAVHTLIRESPLSSESNFINYRGFFNLAALVLIIGNFRLVIENLLLYGILIHKYPPSKYLLAPLLLWGLFGLNVFIIIAFVIEKLASTRKTDNVLSLLRNLNLACTLCIPLGTIIYLDPPAVSGMLLAGLSCNLWLKLTSYALVNREFKRKAEAQKNKVDKALVSVAYPTVEYPDNLTLRNMYFFIVAPTLVYQLNYPQTKKIRWFWLAGKCFQVVFFFLLMIFMVIQYIIPSVHSSVSSIKEGRIGHALERILKLAIPCLFIWILGFYTFFHLGLNIVAELLRFGDREFYKDWWNSTTLAEYWRKWNMPVHNWLMRHVYFPILRLGYSKPVAQFLIFLLSAIFHELLISVPLRSFNLWFFFGMLGQIPLIMFSEKYTRASQYGNILFWVSFCILGQPILILLYYQDYHDLQVSHRGLPLDDL